jgi:hypothetical protein
VNEEETGKMAWRQAVAGPLAGATCLWQDLDGLHVEPAPELPPPTSILWAWADDGSRLARVRLDNGIALVAVHHDQSAGQARGGRTLPWSLQDGRIAASQGRGPAPEDGGVGAVYEQIVVDGISEGVGPVTFLRLLRPAQGT